MLRGQDLKIISSWLRDQSEGESLLNPKLSLTLVREFHPIWPSFEYDSTQ